MSRTFIAVRIPVTVSLSDVLRHLAKRRFAANVVRAEDLHVTLVFLGETDESRLPALNLILAETAATEVSQSISLRGMGAFPQIDRPAVVWAGVANPASLERMAELLAQRCEEIGFARETRPFHPHITLARTRGRPSNALPEFIHERSDLDFGTIAMTQLELLRSDPGPRYTTVFAAPLANAAESPST